MLIAACHTEASGWTEVHDLERLSDLRAEAGTLLWAEADLASLTEEDVRLIAEEFGLHPLAVEDAQHPWQRPKIDFYQDHVFLVVHQLDHHADQLEATQLACFVGKRYVLTIHAGATRVIEETKARWKRTSKEADDSASFLMHALLDALVDDYQAMADRLENEIEDLEEIVLETPEVPIQRQLYSVKQRIARLRRYALPASRVVDTFIEPDHELYIPEAEALYSDVRDHLLRIGEQIRNVDELAQAVLDLTRAEQAQRLNEVTKRLTGWAAIIAVPTYIASVYGMNFALLPEEESLSGFFFALGLMIVSGVVLYLFFKRRRWI
ncbi:MAG: magnesium transporter CorA family protein [Actinomycetota bacterium]